MIEDWRKLPIVTGVWLGLMLILSLGEALGIIPWQSIAINVPIPTHEPEPSLVVSFLRASGFIPQESKPFEVTIWNYVWAIFFFPLCNGEMTRRPIIVVRMLLFAVFSSMLEKRMVGGNSTKLYMIGMALNAVASVLAVGALGLYVASTTLIYSVVSWACYNNPDMVILPTSKYPGGIINPKILPWLIGFGMCASGIGQGELEFSGILIGMMTYYILRIFGTSKIAGRDLPAPENVGSVSVKPVLSFSRMTMIRIRDRKLE